MGWHPKADSELIVILTTHPIQYQVPLWKELARDGRVPFEVWYLTDHGTRPSRDRDFGETFAWDIDTLSGYPYQFLSVAEGATPSKLWKCRLTERLRDRLRSSGATVLWIQGWHVAAYWQAVREARAAGVEVWLRGESNDLSRQSLWMRFLKRIRLGSLFPRVDRFLYIGAANRRLYQRFGVTDSRLYPAPYAVDNDRFAEQAANLRPRRPELRRQWNIPNDAFCVLFCGKFVAMKRPMDLVAAAAQLQHSGLLPNIHLLFAGSGVLGSELRRSCNVVFDAAASGPSVAQSKAKPPSNHLSLPKASFTGFLNQTQISQAYVAADCLVLPSDYKETWGLVVNEALASGLPCLASSECGCAEDLAGESGTFDSGNIPMLMSKLIESRRRKSSQITPPDISRTVSSIVSAYGDALSSTKVGSTLCASSNR